MTMAGPSSLPSKQQLTSLVASLPALFPVATNAGWTPEAMAASLSAYADWAASVRKWHGELDAAVRVLERPKEATLDGLLDTWIATPYATPFTLADAERDREIQPNTLHAYLVNEVTPNYRRFRALADEPVANHIPAAGSGSGAQGEKKHQALDALSTALDDMLAAHVLPHIAPGHSADVASVSFLQFVVHELLPSWMRFRERNGDAVRRAAYGDEVVGRLVETLEGALEGQVRCGCHPEALRQ
ncbi:hypothetical protein CC85DRAFT_98762 [Cutaneotrichosporon oleaginosum]|uniref:Uncharacterized protein n=1 Tax=Cutaneotrichosporon oleaginosum TaxID=879819 RepID=A0A0J0XLU6_9TREE|nr:uncharacterized protein CC85DRAFT_98762 [Cutaneotrichosporon oleaginosum]KLT42072.1 hypothetical protein CC85DRAFT_98762 [Cutaneotrichosporon oleaginosum]TXT04689.1 hypothetical protein COLE_07508 [Cutaneotrichosporon oleaginosum]